VHCELIVPGLLPQQEDAKAALEGLRLPGLEMLLARGRRTTNQPLSLEAWLMQAFDQDADDEVPAGALTYSASGGAPGDATWMRADPSHLRLNRDQLILVPAVAFGVPPAEAQGLVESLNQHFAGQLTFYPVPAERWCVRIEGSIDEGLRTLTPAQVAGKDINRHLPSGADSKRWHATLNEIQMVLHEHAINERREGRGEPAINSVWLWGAGRMPVDAAATFQSVTADDPVALGFAKAAGLRYRPVPLLATQWLSALPGEGHQLLVLDLLRMPLALSDLETWRARIIELETRWFSPLLDALKAGDIGMVTVLVPDAEQSRAFESTRIDLRHFWRRMKPLAAYISH
jgi:hypothetical protein